jgi:CRP-like cAMP-binding protein
MPSTGPGKIDPELLRMRAITAALIEQVPFFKNARTEFLRDSFARLDGRVFAPGDVVVHEADVGDEMYFLTKGRVAVLRSDPPEQLTVLPPGSFFGELAILKDAPRAAALPYSGCQEAAAG